ncbi:hypothetical protein COTS27_01625 [Spirochaetota bacterium]|nr:hypothetical protein COTS27_01625 [Spirochaetota bacterium]
MPETAPSHSNSFFHNDPITCPVCSHKFKREVMRFGHGRLITTDTDDELKQNYKFSKKFGAIYPYIYNVLVCPECWFATLVEDFSKKDFYDYANLKTDTRFRIRKARELFPQAEFDVNRTLETGLLGYFLAMICYTYCNDSNFAHGKKSIAAIRASWCAGELHHLHPESSYDILKQYFRYTSYLESSNHLATLYADKSKQRISIELYGPDVNKDMGFDGFLYLSSYLNLEFLILEPSLIEQYKRLEKISYTLSKVFGLGKTSQQKPSILTNKARDLYENTKLKIDAFETENTDLVRKIKAEQSTTTSLVG